MFQLRDSQLNAFRDAEVRGFEDRTIEHLRTCFAGYSASYSDDELRARIRRAMARCPDYEFTTERQIVCFVDTGILAGENFDTDPNNVWAQFALNERGTPADERASAILDVAIHSRRIAGR